MYKFLEGFIGCLVGFQCAVSAVNAHTLGIFLHVFTVKFQQFPFVLPDTVHCILDKFSRDVALFVKYLPVMAVYFFLQPINFYVNLLCDTAFPCQAVLLGIPQFRLHFHFRGELCDFGIDGNSSHERTQAVLLYLLSVDVEQYRESIVGGAAFFLHGFILLLCPASVFDVAVWDVASSANGL